jgi:hypothetical protein
MADDNTQYIFQSVKAVRGTEAKTIAKWEADGWELHGQKPRTLRTEITFRQPRTTSPLKKITRQGWESFRRRSLKVQLASAGGLVLLIVAIAIVIGVQRDRGTPTSAVSKTEAAGPSSSRPSRTTSSEATTATSAPSDAEQTLTVDNSHEFAALLVTKDYCADPIAAFATKHAGENIEFDGNISALSKHGDYRTRYDILVGAGDYSETSAPGPAFQFKDVGVVDLHLRGSNVPDSVGRGDNLHIVAEVGDYNPKQCLLFLQPVSTEVR